jgi:tetratricopeptide (TPR) repeat protein
MAPEQHKKSAVDARSDQFGYCATLYEALYGEPPFEAGEDDYKTNVAEGRVRPAPEGSRVPKHLRQIVLRGLAAKPEDRWPSMDALLAELRRDPAATRRRVITAAVAVLLVGAAAGAAMLASPGRAPPPCTGAEGKLAGVWDDAAKRAVEAAFAATGKAGAADAAARVERTLDDYAKRWTGARTDACLATKTRGEQSEELLDLRMECYDDRLRELGAQARVLAHADAAALDRASQAAGTLTPLDGCADTAALRAPIRPPTDAGARDRVEAVRARLAEGRAKQRVGGYAEAKVIAAGAAQEASSLGYAPLEAEALYLDGDVEDDLGDYKAAEQTLLRSASAALAGHHDDALARALSALVVEVGLRQARFEEAHAWAALARAAADRGSVFVRGEERRNVGRVLLREGKLADARAQTEECLALWKPALGDDAFPIAGALTDLGNAYFGQGDYARATDTYERSIDVLEKTVGPDSPSLGPNLNNLGEVASRIGQYDRALAALERALAVWTAGLGPTHPKVGLATYNIGEVWRRRGEPERAITEYRKALAIDEAALGPESPETAYPVEGIADAMRAAGDAKGALPFYARALAIREKALGPTHDEVAATLTGLGQAKLATGDRHAAVALLQRALAIRTAAHGDPADLADTRAALDASLRAR